MDIHNTTTKRTRSIMLHYMNEQVEINMWQLKKN